VLISLFAAECRIAALGLSIVGIRRGWHDALPARWTPALIGDAESLFGGKRHFLAAGIPRVIRARCSPWPFPPFDRAVDEVFTSRGSQSACFPLSR